jgi:hypothetical protein
MGNYSHHKYTWQKPFGSERHNWELVTAEGGINFHVSKSESFGASCGLEYHHTSGEGAPHHVNCPLTGGRCWHDGTSLYATDHLWPMIEPYLKKNEHERIFKILEGEAQSHFHLKDDQE